MRSPFPEVNSTVSQDVCLSRSLEVVSYTLPSQDVASEAANKIEDTRYQQVITRSRYLLHQSDTEIFLFYTITLNTLFVPTYSVR